MTSELESAILADPDDLATYLVYADWLQAHGYPRGELIVLVQAFWQRADRGDQRRPAVREHPLDLLVPGARWT
ncbi:MAG TPA: TIGR02996 domain-containing protein [Kofleriaceae bacterium]